MKNLLWLFAMFSFLGCTSPREKRYNQMIDSLNRLDFPPRVFDTLLFNTAGKSFFLDTIYPNGIHQKTQYSYNGNYISYIRHKDSLIRDVLEYDTIDAKLLTWNKEYIHGEGIGAYEIFYLKDGNVELLGTPWYNNVEGYIKPGYSIHRLIAKLRDEKLDLLHHSCISYGKKEFYNPDSTLNRTEWCWYVDLKDTIGNPQFNVVERLYDGQTGAFIDSSRIQERWRYDDWKY